MNEQSDSSQLDQLFTYIQYNLNQGVPENHIRHTLLQYNWRSDLVDMAFASIRAPQTPHPPAPRLYPEPSASNQPANLATTPWEQPNNPPTQAPRVSEPTQQHSPELNVPQKYTVGRALGDMAHAIRNNARVFFLSVLFSYAVAAVLLLGLLFGMEQVLSGDFSHVFSPTAKAVTLLLGNTVLYAAWYALANALTIATISLALSDGHENRKSSKRSLSTIISQSFAKLGRIILATILLDIITFVPALLVLCVPLIMLLTGAGGIFTIIILLPLLGLVALIWAYIALVRFVLAPYVALFEPNVPITKTLGRSKHLLAKGGQWFLVKGFLLVLLTIIILSAVFGQNPDELTDSSNIAINLCLILVSIIANGVLAMLYRNRKLVRDVRG